MRSPILALTLLAVTISCIEGTSPPLDPSPEALVATFSQTADSLNRSGDSVSGSTYGMAADLIRAGVRPTAISVRENGVPTPWMALAQRYSFPAAGCNFDVPSNPAPGTTIVLPPPACAMRFAPVLFAWRATEPTRMLTVVAPDGNTSATALPGSPVGAWAALSDRVARQIFFSRSGSVSVVAPASTSPCPEALALPLGATGTCTTGDFTIGFDLTLHYPSDSLGGGPGTPQHLVLAARGIAGVLVQVMSAGAGVPITIPSRPPVDSIPGTIPPLPPSTPHRDSLPATLAVVKNAGTIEFSLTVRNHTNRMQAIIFNSGQRIDVRLLDAATGNPVALWSAGRAFTTAIGVDSLAAGATRTYRADWASPPNGSWRAVGFLTSMSHIATGVATVAVP